MSTLQKAMNLLQDMPEPELQAAYIYLLYLKDNYHSKEKNSVSSFGIAHKYANPELITKEKEAFRNAIYRKHVLD